MLKPLSDGTKKIVDPLSKNIVDPVSEMLAVADKQLFGSNMSNKSQALQEELPGEPPPGEGEPPLPAVVIRAVASCAQALGRQASFMAPLTHILLAPTVQSLLVHTLYAASSHGLALRRDAARTETTIATAHYLREQATRACGGVPGSDASVHETALQVDGGAQPSVEIPNPFREAVLAPLTCCGTPPEATAAPLAAWVLQEIRVACPAVLPSLPPAV